MARICQSSTSSIFVRQKGAPPPPPQDIKELPRRDLVQSPCGLRLSPCLRGAQLRLYLSAMPTYAAFLRGVMPDEREDARSEKGVRGGRVHRRAERSSRAAIWSSRLAPHSETALQRKAEAAMTAGARPELSSRSCDRSTASAGDAGVRSIPCLPSPAGRETHRHVSAGAAAVEARSPCRKSTARRILAVNGTQRLQRLRSEHGCH